MSTIPELVSFLGGLRAGDRVILTRDGKDHHVTVQSPLTRGDGGGFGSSDHAKVTVGYGPGRWNTEVSAVGIRDGFYALRVTAAGWESAS